MQVEARSIRVSGAFVRFSKRTGCGDKMAIDFLRNRSMSHLEEVGGASVGFAAPLQIRPDKPGYKTTEFYVAVATQVVSVLVLLGVLGPEVKDTANQFITDLVVHGTAMIALVTSAWRYIDSRTKAKTPGPVTIVEN